MKKKSFPSFIFISFFMLSLTYGNELEQKPSFVNFEISPHAGFMGGGGALGIRAAMNYSSLALEMAAEEIVGRTATTYPLTANLVVNLASSPKIVPYGIVGAGLFFTVPENAVGSQTISTIGLNFGGGLRYYINSKVGIRFESKQLFSRFKNNFDQNKLVIFQGASLGVIFVFG